MRIQIQNRLTDGIDLVRRDYVIRKGIMRTRCRVLVARARIVDSGLSSIGVAEIGQVGNTLRKVSRTLQVCWNESFQVARILLPDLFEIHKEECLVLNDWPADREAVLIPHMVGLVSRIEEVARIKVGSLPVPPAAAMKCVGTLLQHHVHDRAAVISELRRKAVVLYFEFLHDFDRGLVIDVGVATLALFRRTERTAIERNLRGRVTLAVGVKVGTGGIPE